MNSISRRQFIVQSTAAITGVAAHPLGSTVPFVIDPQKEIILAPKDPGLWPDFRKQLSQWRSEKCEEMHYSDLLYQKAEFRWVSSCFSCCFLMLCDETFYDHTLGIWTPEAFLNHGAQEFGGYDSVVLWHAYPRIGLDERNQFDFYRDMPGGLPGLLHLSRLLHQKNIRVFVDYNPWDTGTRREQKTDIDALCDLVKSIEADGIFLDTMDKGAEVFRARLDAARSGVVLEGEIALPINRIHDHHLSWAQWFQDSEVPGVLRNKWFERRHMQHQIKRWDYDHSAEIHTAWMNGSGMMVWENVFGTWMGWNQRDRSLLRAMLPIQRRFASVFNGEGWLPLVSTNAAGVYASLWQGDNVRLWTLINRSKEDITGILMSVELQPEEKVYDLISGKEAQHRARDIRNGQSIVDISGSLSARGIGCILVANPSRLGTDFQNFLERQAALNQRFSGNTAYPQRTTLLKKVGPTLGYLQPLPDMAGIPAAEFVLRTELRERECGFYDSTPASNHRLASSYEFRAASFERKIKLSPYAIDLTPVTNAQFAEFLRQSGYKPRHTENFLRHWTNGKIPSGLEDHPVVYVSLDDARAYARWHAKRLPLEEEWQYAAQGPNALRYPWGNEMISGKCNSGQTGTTTPVKAFSEGRSPFGVYDLCGNVWEWTESERTDGRTRFAILKGGSYFSAIGSGWYMNGGARPNAFGAKMLLMWDGLDRCSTVGFRCVIDLAASNP